MDEDAYKSRQGTNFTTPSRPAIYDVDIPINASNAVRFRREAGHTAKKEFYRLFTAVERESIKFILAVVEDTWVRELSDPDLFNTAVKPWDLPKHLQAMCVGLHDTDILNLQNDIQTYHDRGYIPKVFAFKNPYPLNPEKSDVFYFLLIRMKQPKSQKIQKAVSSSSELHAIQRIPRDTTTLAFLFILRQNDDSSDLVSGFSHAPTVIVLAKYKEEGEGCGVPGDALDSV